MNAAVPLIFSKPVTVAIDVAAWGAIHASTGYFVHRISTARLSRDWWFHRERRFERGGRLYERTFRIKTWKKWLPEAGALFAGGFDKKQLRQPRDDAYLERYVVETRRAELGHWLAAAPAPLFFAFNPYQVGIVMLVYATVANGPCVLSQRYNRLRLQRILSKRRNRP